MNSISLICVYNNQKQMEEMVESTKNQDMAIEYIMIDNTKKAFPSAAQAITYGVQKAKNNVVVFLHQDIEFLSENVLNDIFTYLTQNPNSLVGAAGVKKNFGILNQKKVYSNIFHEASKERVTSTPLLQEPMAVFTLDECLIATTKEALQKISFDTKVCDGWHLYGADLCMQAQLKSMAVMVLPMSLWHKSAGKIDSSYFDCMKILSKKYEKNFKVINTCCTAYPTHNGVHKLLVNTSNKLIKKLH